MNDCSYSGKNLYVTPSTFDNDPLYLNFIKPRQSPQKNSTQQQAVKINKVGMTSPSSRQQKPKKGCMIHYHSSGQEFAATHPLSQPSETATQGKIVVFPETEDFNDETFGDYSCENCGKCYDCRMKKSREVKKQGATWIQWAKLGLLIVLDIWTIVEGECETLPSERGWLGGYQEEQSQKKNKNCH